MADDYNIRDAASATRTMRATDDGSALHPHHVIEGVDDSGTVRALSTTGEGHLEVAIHGPRNPFGSVHAEELTPIFQTDAVYGINTQQVATTTSGGGSATASDSMFSVNTGTTSGAFGVIQSRKRLRYRPGQGVVGRFAGLFTTPVASSYQTIGFGHSEDGFYFGYNGTSFGILYVNRGVREVRTLTVTTASTATNDYNVTLNGTSYNVTATNNASTTQTAWEIAQGTFTGWTAEAVGATVVFVRNSAGTVAGAFSLAQSGAGTPAAGTFAQTKAGAASTDTWIAQASWNGDPMDGTGPSGITIDPTLNNVYQIGIQYLGAGAVTFAIENAPSNGNNAEFVTVHTIRFPNTLTTTALGNPSFPFTMAAYSAGSTTDLTVKVGSFAGFIEGHKLLHGPRTSFFGTTTAATSSTYTPIFTIRNPRYFAGRTNQSVVNLISILGALKHNQPGSFHIIRNGTLAGTPSFAANATGSCIQVDTASTGVTISDNNQLVWSAPLAETSSVQFELGTEDGEITLQPGEWVSVCARTASGTATYASASLNVREDQ